MPICTWVYGWVYTCVYIFAYRAAVDEAQLSDAIDAMCRYVDVCRHACTDMCVDRHADMCADMVVGMYTGAYLGMCKTCVWKYSLNLCLQVFINMHLDISFRHVCRYRLTCV